MILSLILLLLLLLLLLPLIPPSRRRSINRPNQTTAPSKISSLVTPVKEKRRQIRGMGIMQMGIMQMGIKDMGTRQPRALPAFEIPLSAQQTGQV